jgi:predicted MFS family arabinose efflux permease
MYATLLFMPVYLDRHGYDTSVTGLLLFAFSFAMSMMSYFGGRLGRTLGARRIIALAFGLDLVVVVWYLALNQKSDLAFIIGGLIVAGIGAGIGTVTMQATMLEAVQADMAGTASGIYSTFRYLGSITASALVSLMVASLVAHVIILSITALVGLAVLGGFSSGHERQSTLTSVARG